MRLDYQVHEEHRLWKPTFLLKTWSQTRFFATDDNGAKTIV